MLKRPAPVFAFAIAVALLGLTWVSVKRPAAHSAALDTDRPRYYLDDTEWVRYDANGNPEQRVRTQRIEMLADDSARLTELTVDQLGGEQGPWVLRAPTGYSPPDSRRLLLENTVTVEGHWPGDPPLKLETQQMWVDSQVHQIYTDTPVSIAGVARSADADGMRADWDADRVQLQGNVKVRYDPGE